MTSYAASSTKPVHNCGTEALNLFPSKQGNHGKDTDNQGVDSHLQTILDDAVKAECVNLGQPTAVNDVEILNCFSLAFSCSLVLWFRRKLFSSAIIGS